MFPLSGRLTIDTLLEYHLKSIINKKKTHINQFQFNAITKIIKPV